MVGIIYCDEVPVREDNMPNTYKTDMLDAQVSPSKRRSAWMASKSSGRIAFLDATYKTGGDEKPLVIRSTLESFRLEQYCSRTSAGSRQTASAERHASVAAVGRCDG